MKQPFEDKLDQDSVEAVPQKPLHLVINSNMITSLASIV